MGLKYIQRFNGKPFKVPIKNHTERIACCDCGLVHDFNFEVKGTFIIVHAKVNKRSTAQRRRNKKVSESIMTLGRIATTKYRQKIYKEQNK